MYERATLSLDSIFIHMKEYEQRDRNTDDNIYKANQSIQRHEGQFTTLNR